MALSGWHFRWKKRRPKTKYKLYRAQYEMQFDENGEPLEWEDAFELVGVEYAQDVDRATPLLIKAITDELGTTPQYANCEVAAYAPDLYRQELSEDYDYEMMGIVYPPNANHNILIPFLVKEETATPD